jgi:NodT family efflux transporter outer membrane factor (OMF) lipoprotein
MTRHSISALALAAAALGLAGCADMSGIQPRATLRDAASVGLPDDAADKLAPVDAQWWRQLGDPQLNALIEQALATSPNLRLAQARLERARAVTELTDAARLPQVNGSLDLTHQRYTRNGAVPAPLAGSIRDTGTLQLGLNWELDFFGKNDAAIEAALGAARAADADAQAAGILLASSVARSYYQLARVNAQIAVAERTLSQREETLRLVRDRVNAGLDTRLELRQSEGGIPEARQQVEALREQAGLLRNAIAALVGQPAVAQSLQDVALPQGSGWSGAQGMPDRIPADLLGRRADIAAARERVRAAGYDVDAARAQFYPNINLVAFAGLSSIGLGRLLESGSQQWGVGPAIRLPIFEGGRLRANLRSKAADLDAAVESYNTQVLEAVRDVADQLGSAQSIARQQALQREAQAASESAYDLALQRYKAGLTSYLTVLTAESAVLNQRRQAVDLSARALDTRLALIRALGGGYSQPAPAGALQQTAAVR